MNRCAFPGCTTPIVMTDTGTLVAEVCHIRAQSEKGPRYDPSQSDEERHGFDNLVLMCRVHHKVIDATRMLRPTPWRRCWRSSTPTSNKRVSLVSSLRYLRAS
jgi:hypothetical protein